MSTTIISLLTSFIYIVTAFLQYQNLFSKMTFKKMTLTTLSSAAILLHSYVLYRWIDTPFGQNLSLSHLFSLICWLITLITLSTSLIKAIERKNLDFASSVERNGPMTKNSTFFSKKNITTEAGVLQSLFLFILPLSALSILLSILFPGENTFQTRQHPNTLIHILISVFAFGVLGTAAMQAILLYLQNRLLRKKSAHHSIIKILPSLQTMETFLFQIIWSGFLLLSASLASAFLLTDELITNNRLQKIFLSFLAWSLFAALLYGHHQSGLRGQKAAAWTLTGVGLLIGAYLAGKIIPMD